MAYGYAGSISKFNQEASESDFGKIISKKRQNTGGHRLSAEEESLWDTNGPILVDLLSSLSIPINNSYVIAEYDIPGHLGRCDLLIIGKGKRDKRNIALIEIKNWSSFSRTADNKYIEVAGHTCRIPFEQVLGYRDNLHYFHKKSNDYCINACLLFMNLNGKYTNTLRQLGSQEASHWSIQVDKNALIKQLNEWFCDGLPLDDFESFLYGKYKQSTEYSYQLRKHIPYITKGVAEAISGKPLDLTDKQSEIVSEIGCMANDPAGGLLIVKGAPGSGKTIVGLNALCDRLAMDGQAKVVLALRNNRLCTVVRDSINDAGKLRVANNLVKYVKPSGPPTINGVYYEIIEKLGREGGDYQPPYNLIIIDEAHRIPHINSKNPDIFSQLESVLLAGNTVVCLVDENQILNMDDEGTTDNIKGLWKKLYPSKKIRELYLSEQHRLPAEQMEWLEHLLKGKIEKRPRNYEMSIADSPKELIDYLNERKGNNKCGLLASFTYSNGRKGNTLRVPELDIHWLMTLPEYSLWWRNDEIRHSFKQCSSVYGCQGFELDYSGLFWGKDLFMQLQNGIIDFQLHPNQDITDAIGMQYGDKFKTLARKAQNNPNSEVAKTVVDFLLNRYRILLSRASKGIVIYCEDETTQNALKQIIEQNN